MLNKKELIKVGIKMQEMIKINYDNNSDRITVSGRDLYNFLEVGTKYADWINRMCEYGFTEGSDYKTFFSNLGSGMHGGQNKVDHQITVDMAKEISMIQRSEKGKQARQYFISCEKQLHTQKQLPSYQIEDPIKRARMWITEQEEKKQIMLERDYAVKTKAWISDSKTATALGKVGGLTTSNNKLKTENTNLKEELGKCKEYATILAVQRFTKKEYKWRALKDYCTANELEIKEASDARFGIVKSYPATAWSQVYNVDLDLLF